MFKQLRDIVLSSSWNWFNLDDLFELSLSNSRIKYLPDFKLHPKPRNIELANNKLQYVEDLEPYYNIRRFYVNLIGNSLSKEWYSQRLVEGAHSTTCTPTGGLISPADKLFEYEEVL